jgi:hypothetical protein
VSRRKPSGVGRMCGHANGRHYVSCLAIRSKVCQRAPATVGQWCAPCHAKMQKGRRAIIAERLAAMRPKDAP